MSHISSCSQTRLNCFFFNPHLSCYRDQFPWKMKWFTWKSTHLHLSGRMKKGSTGQGGFPACSVGQLLGNAYPSNPGFNGISGMVFLHERHCTVILVALTRIAEALMMIPGIFTSLETWSLCNRNVHKTSHEMEECIWTCSESIFYRNFYSVKIQLTAKDKKQSWSKLKALWHSCVILL